MAKVYPGYHQDIDAKSFCRPYTQDSDGNQRRMGSKSESVTLIKSSLNDFLARHTGTIFTKAFTYDAAPSASLDNEFSFRYCDSRNNARTISVSGIAYPPVSGTILPFYIEMNSAAGTKLNQNIPADANTFFHTESFTFKIDRGDRSDAVTEYVIDHVGSYKLMSLTIQEDPLTVLDTDVHYYVEPATPHKGDVVTSAEVQQCCDAIEEIRKNHMPIYGSWSAIGRSTASDAPGNDNGVVIKSESYVNALDQSVTSRTANSPGQCCDAYCAGVGKETVDDGKKVPVICEVLAEADVNSSVKFIGPDHIASNEAVIAVTGGVAWYGSDTDIIYLNSSAQYDDATTACNKVDVHGKCDSTPSTGLKIYGWRFRAAKLTS